MTIFYISRHGQTENNKHGLLSGWIDTPLTEAGVQNALSAAAKLAGQPIDKIVSSDLGRTFVTAYLVARKLGYTDEIERYAGVREVNYGVLANARIADYPSLTPQENTDYAPEGGESLAQMQRRALECIDVISRENPAKTVLIVAHDGTINAVHARFTNTAIGVVDATGANPHDFVGKFTYDSGAIIDFVEVH